MSKSLNHKKKLSHNGAKKADIEYRAKHWKYGKSSGKKKEEEES
jgi:hypothetical protein